MECASIRRFFSPLYAIILCSSFASTTPNIFDLSRTRGANLHTAANQLRSSIFSLRSADPLSTHIPKNAGIRLGRSLPGNIEETCTQLNHKMRRGYYDASDLSTKNYHHRMKKSMGTNIMKRNLLVVQARGDNDDHSAFSVSPCINVTSRPSHESYENDESRTVVETNNTNVSSYIRDTEEGGRATGTRRVRKSKGTSKFLRFGKAAMAFNRYDRGNDNFMRFGRSNVNDGNDAENFGRFVKCVMESACDEALDDERNSDDEDEDVERKTRKLDSFIRLGRPSSDFFLQRAHISSYVDERDVNANYDNAEINEMKERFKHNFVRLPQHSKHFLQLIKVNRASKCIDAAADHNENYVDKIDRQLERERDPKMEKRTSSEWSGKNMHHQGSSLSSKVEGIVVCPTHTLQKKQNTRRKSIDGQAWQNRNFDIKCEGYRHCRSTERVL